MRTFLIVLAAQAIIVILGSSANAEIPMKNPKIICGFGIQELEMIWDDADDTSGFNDRDQIGAMMNEAYRLLAAKCGAKALMTYSITIKDARGNVGFKATASLYGSNRNWDYQTRMPQLIEAGKQQARANEIARKALEARQATARQNCGQQAAISGGPWFSSTYKVAVNDAIDRDVRSGRIFCIKSVEYVSAAPNPMGGNAARIKFTGYDQMLKLIYYVVDIPY